MDRHELVVGMDAGGSKTRVIVGPKEQIQTGKADDFEKLIFGPANVCHSGKSGVRRVIREMVGHLPVESHHRIFVLGGFAGAGDPEIRGVIARLFEDAGFRRENVAITTDAGLLIMAMGGSGVALIAGTGSICAGKRGPAPDKWGDIDVRAGGYGYRLPSETGGYRLGIGAIDAALRIADGRVAGTSILTQHVRDHLGLSDIRQVTSILYPPGELDRGIVTARVSGLAGMVLETAHEGDRIARQLVEETVEELAGLVRTVLAEMGPGHTEIGLHGGLFTDPHAEELLMDPLKDRLKRMGHELRFISLGIKIGDPDPVVEALKFTLASRPDRHL